MEPKFKKYEVVYCKKAGYPGCTLGIVVDGPISSHPGDKDPLYKIALLVERYLEKGAESIMDTSYNARESSLEHLPMGLRSGALYPTFGFWSNPTRDAELRSTPRTFKKYEVVDCSRIGYADGCGRVTLGIVYDTPENHPLGKYQILVLTPLYLDPSRTAGSAFKLFPAASSSLDHLPAKYLSTALYPDGIIPATIKSEEDKTMTKNNNFKSVELRNGDVVVNKEGEAFIVFNGGDYSNMWMHSATTSRCYYLSDSGEWIWYDSDEVVPVDEFKRVLRPVGPHVGIKEAADITKRGRSGIHYDLVWEYQEAKELTVAEIEKLLGYSIKVVKEG